MLLREFPEAKFLAILKKYILFCRFFRMFFLGKPILYIRLCLLWVGAHTLAHWSIWIRDAFFKCVDVSLTIFRCINVVITWYCIVSTGIILGEGRRVARAFVPSQFLIALALLEERLLLFILCIHIIHLSCTTWWTRQEEGPYIIKLLVLLMLLGTTTSVTSYASMLMLIKFKLVVVLLMLLGTTALVLRRMRQC